MFHERPVLRRLSVFLGVIAVLALGVGSIRAAAAWTAAEAPLLVAPTSVETIQGDLEAEHARAVALTQQMRELDARSAELEAALAQANDRIANDASHADELEGRLADAKAKLHKLEKAVAKAKRQLAAQLTTARSAATTVSRTSSAGDDDGQHDDDGEEHDD